MGCVGWHLKEQIEIYRLMLHRVEFIPTDRHDCEHYASLLRKISILQQGLDDFKNQTAT